MSKYNLEEGNDSLKRILLMMKYDNKKTLSENVEEQYSGRDAQIQSQSQTPTTKKTTKQKPQEKKDKNADLTDQDLLGDTNVLRSWIQMGSDFGSALGVPNLFDIVGVNFANLIGGRRTGVKGVVDALDGWVDAKDLGYILSVLNSIKGKCYLDDTLDPPQRIPAMKRFLELYQEDENEDLKDEVNSVGTRTLPTGTEKIKKKIINVIDSSMGMSCKAKKDSNKGQTSGSGKYKQCSGTYKLYCYNKPVIGKVQGCLGLKQDGYFGPKTQSALKSVGFGNGFTDQDVDKICKTSQKPNTQVRPKVKSVSTIKPRGIQSQTNTSQPTQPQNTGGQQQPTSTNNNIDTLN